MTQLTGLVIVLGVMAGAGTPRPVFASSFPNSSGTETLTTLPRDGESPSSSHPALPGRFELRFRNAPLPEVLEYLSRVAGLVIVSDQSLKKQIDLWTEAPVGRDEAIDLLNISLQTHGITALLNGHKLVLMADDETKLRRTSIKLGADPETIPGTERIVTQIIPVRFVEVNQLLKDLQPLVSREAMLTANESANTVVVTDQQRNIQKLSRIISAIDLAAEDPMAIQIFSLSNAAPTEMAELLSDLFPDQASGANSGGDAFAPFAPGPPGGGPDGPSLGSTAGSSTSGSNAQTERLQKRARVIAQAEERTTSLVVVAAQSLMPQIERVVAQLDSNPKGRQVVGVYPFANSSLTSVKQMMSDLFQKHSSTANNRATAGQGQTDALETRLTSQAQQSQQAQPASSARAGANSGSGNGM